MVFTQSINLPGDTLSNLEYFLSGVIMIDFILYFVKTLHFEFSFFILIYIKFCTIDVNIVKYDYVD